MARPIYSYEMEDPDFCWLISKYKENHPSCLSVEATCLPVVIISLESGAVSAAETPKLPMPEATPDFSDSPSK
jgi:hypothetical protein